MKITRKRRCDRNHILYQIVNKQTGEKYIGLTAVQNGNAMDALISRWRKHVYRAMVEQSHVCFSQSIRKYGHENFQPSILETIRGKEFAFKRERELIGQLNPQLNTF